MPDYDLVLEPAWGYVGVEVEVGQAVTCYSKSNYGDTGSNAGVGF
ncbi:MAG: hypothetical protein ACLSCV_12245 [Acutalibacteraceae bacterium]